MTLIKFKNDRLNAPRVFNDFVEDFFNKDFPALFHNSSSTPAVNVVESKDGYKLELALPGINKENISINLEGNLLTVSGRNENKLDDEKENYTRREFSFATFSRTFTLPESADGEKISADYSDGILKVSIPKMETAKDKGPKAIKIS